MADERAEPRDLNLRQLLPWTELFRGFQVALDPKKLVLAAGGILTMALGWWLLSVIFFAARGPAPTYASGSYKPEDWKALKEDRAKWDLLYEAAGTPRTDGSPEMVDANDLASNADEYALINQEIQAGHRRFTVNGTSYVLYYGDGQDREEDPALYRRVQGEVGAGHRRFLLDGKTFVYMPKPYGDLRSWPFFEDRGPNPYLLVAGRAGQSDVAGAPAANPWEAGHFLNWFATKQVPVLVEPLRKFLRPVVFLLHPRAGFWNDLYFTLVLLWTVATWAFFGGMITRMAAVQVARREKIGMGEAFRFTVNRYLSFFSAPLFPLLFVLGIVVLCILFGFFHMIPIVGDILVDGLGWPLVLLAGLVMAVILVGLVGWPMMYATISAEGSDSFDALSRSYSYVYQNPWHYVWYCLVSIVYGAALIFFVGFMGSFLVYLGKWAVSRTPWIDATDRNPSYLFVYAPTSFGWRELLLQGATVETRDAEGHVTGAKNVVGPDGIDPDAYNQYVNNLPWYKRWGAFLVSRIWTYLVFLLVIGFGYSYFWSAGTIIYLLMRRKVDDTEMDEVYLEEEEPEDFYQPPTSAGAAAKADAGQTSLTMVEPPALKTPPPAAPPPAPPPAKVESVPPERGDGSQPA